MEAKPKHISFVIRGNWHEWQMYTIRGAQRYNARRHPTIGEEGDKHTLYIMDIEISETSIGDRKSVVKGKRVDIGVLRIIKKKMEWISFLRIPSGDRVVRESIVCINTCTGN